MMSSEVYRKVSGLFGQSSDGTDKFVAHTVLGNDDAG